MITGLFDRKTEYQIGSVACLFDESVCAYFELLQAPQKIQPRDNLHCWFCPIDRDYRYPLTVLQNQRFVAPVAVTDGDR